MSAVKKRVIIIDYHLGNLFSVKQACDTVGMSARISSDKDDVRSADALILPGVGAFSEAMKNLTELNLVNIIIEMAQNGTPIFGICLGLQLLFTESMEFGSGKGLNIIEGSIKRFPNLFNNKMVRVPQIAWNKIYADGNSWENTSLKDLNNNEFMYFVHSYYVQPSDDSCVLAKTNYEEIEYCSSILKNHIFATQFHPEKSSVKGLSIYRNWALINNLLP